MARHGRPTDVISDITSTSFTAVEYTDEEACRLSGKTEWHGWTPVTMMERGWRMAAETAVAEMAAQMQN